MCGFNQISLLTKYGSPSVTLTTTTGPEDRPSTRSISIFPSRSSEVLGSSWLPVSAPADRWVRSWHQRQIVNQHLRSGHQTKYGRIFFQTSLYICWSLLGPYIESWQFLKKTYVIFKKKLVVFLYHWICNKNFNSFLQ